MPEYIARISYGKDSLKMLDVIITRGLPLDLVTTTDVWATDTIPAELPPVLEAKARIEEKLWQMKGNSCRFLIGENDEYINTPVFIFRNRRTGLGCRMGWVSHRRTMRMGGLSTEGFGKALAWTPPVERHPNPHKGEFL